MERERERDFLQSLCIEELYIYIDIYLYRERELLSKVSSCYVSGTLDLTMKAEEDHKAVVDEMRLVEQDARRSPQRECASRINKSNLICPMRCNTFKREMWRFRAPSEAHIDDHLEALNNHTRSAAIACYGKSVDVPRKPWISAASWSIIRLIAPMRRVCNSTRAAVYAHLRGVSFYA